jgi:hypothetical protein
MSNRFIVEKVHAEQARFSITGREAPSDALIGVNKVIVLHTIRQDFLSRFQISKHPLRF